MNNGVSNNTHVTIAENFHHLQETTRMVRIIQDISIEHIVKFMKIIYGLCVS